MVGANGQLIDSVEVRDVNFATWLAGWAKRKRDGEHIAVFVSNDGKHAIVTEHKP